MLVSDCLYAGNYDQLVAVMGYLLGVRNGHHRPHLALTARTAEMLTKHGVRVDSVYDSHR